MPRLSPEMFTFVLIALSSASTDEEIQYLPIARICQENKDYLDGSLVFGHYNWILMGDKYFLVKMDAAHILAYLEDGTQTSLVAEWDASPDPSVRRASAGQLLGGFGIGNEDLPDGWAYNWLNRPHKFSEQTHNLPVDRHPYFVNQSGYYWRSIAAEDLHDAKDYNDPTIDRTIPDPKQDIFTTARFFERFARIRVFLFKDTTQSLYPEYRYHIKRWSRYGLMEIDQQSQWESQLFWKGLTDGFQYRGKIADLFGPINGTTLDGETHLPMVFDEYSLMFLMIANQKTKEDKPRLYFNSFKYRQFSRTWNWTVIEQGLKYTAIIGILRNVAPDGSGDKYQERYYKVIAEPFREDSQERGPSYVFDLRFRDVDEPRLENKTLGGMKKLFRCEYRTTSTIIWYVILGLFILCLLAVIVIIVCFFFVHYFYAKQRVVVLRREPKKEVTYGVGIADTAGPSGSTLSTSFGKDEDSMSVRTGITGTPSSNKVTK